MRISQFMLIGVFMFSAGFAFVPTSMLAAEKTPKISTEKPPEPKPAKQSENIALLKAAQAKLAWELIEKSSKETNADATISPASLASALVVLAEGADTKMRAAIATTLGFDAADTVKALAALSNARTLLAQDTLGMLQSADKIVFPPDSPPPRRVAERLEKLGVDFSLDDLSKPETVAKIDAWVNETTQGAIPKILGEPLDSASFVVLNALHFKGRWLTPFDPRLTVQTAFQSADGKSGDVAMMHLPKAPRLYRADKTFVGVNLPFFNKRYALTVVTTIERPAGVAEFAAAKDWLSGVEFAERKGDLALPRFKLSGRSDLLPTLDALGLDKGRHSPTALVGFGQATRLTGVIQRATIEVDEEGATAAAATAIIGRRAVDNSLHMVVDKPFIFALRDQETGLILVAGYVGQAPSGQSTQ